VGEGGLLGEKWGIMLITSQTKKRKQEEKRHIKAENKNNYKNKKASLCYLLLGIQ